LDRHRQSDGFRNSARTLDVFQRHIAKANILDFSPFLKLYSSAASAA
jgi:hypothetical protein